METLVATEAVATKTQRKLKKKSYFCANPDVTHGSTCISLMGEPRNGVQLILCHGIGCNTTYEVTAIPDEWEEA